MSLVREEGWTVTAFESAEAALPAVLRGDFAALLTDHVLPGMRGLELSLRLRAVYPATPCGVIRGHGSPDGDEVPWPCKPFDLDAPLRAITPS